MARKITVNTRQEIFVDWVLGILVYTLILGLFNDYTSVLYISSTSTIFLAAIVLQALTYGTLVVKKRVAGSFSYADTKRFKPAKFFSLWAILFFSKFVFLAVIDFIFGKNVEISGFVGLMLMIIAMTLIKQAILLSYERLGKQ